MLSRQMPSEGNLSGRGRSTTSRDNATIPSGAAGYLSGGGPSGFATRCSCRFPSAMICGTARPLGDFRRVELLALISLLTSQKRAPAASCPWTSEQWSNGFVVRHGMLQPHRSVPLLGAALRSYRSVQQWVCENHSVSAMRL